jgi:hypothetical protein
MRSFFFTLVLVLVLVSGHNASALSSSIQITETNIRSECPFVIINIKDENGSSGHLKLFRVIVTPPSGFKPENVSGYLSVCRDGKLIVACAVPSRKLERKSNEVDASVKDRSVVLDFATSSDLLASSKFEVILSDPDGAAFFNYWFYLHDFIGGGKDL